MKFSKDFLRDTIGSKNTVLEDITDHSRWTVSYYRVFQHEDKFYQTFYDVGATESQDESPYEYDADEIECDEVFPTEVIVTKYLKKSN